MTLQEQEQEQRQGQELGRFLGCCVLHSQVSAAKSAARNLGHPKFAAGYSLSEIALEQRQGQEPEQRRGQEQSQQTHFKLANGASLKWGTRARFEGMNPASSKED
jgi:hypothetical protein